VGREGGLGLESLASPNAHVPGSVLAAGRAVQVAHSVFQEACDDTIGRLHRLLTESDGDATVDLFAYLREIADAAIFALSMKGQAEILFDLEPNCVIQAKQATAVGLVIGEAITNAVKYSHPTGVPGKIAIMSRRIRDHGLVIEVADDGVGLPEGFDPHRSESTGVALMGALANQLSARLSFEQRPIGLSVRLELPSA